MPRGADTEMQCSVTFQATFKTDSVRLMLEIAECARALDESARNADETGCCLHDKRLAGANQASKPGAASVAVGVNHDPGAGSQGCSSGQGCDMSHINVTQPAQNTSPTSNSLAGACPLREDNSRIYYVPQEELTAVIDSIARLGTSVELPAPDSPVVTSSGGDYILLWLADGIGFVGFLRLPEQLQQADAGSTVQLQAVKAFTPIKSKTLPELRGLSSNPYVFNVGLGKRVADMTDCKSGAKYTYDPESLLKVLQDMWNNANSDDQSIRAHMPRMSKVSNSHKRHLSPQRPAKKRKSGWNETKQLNQEKLLKELVATGMTAERAKVILNTESSGWGVKILTGSTNQLDLTFEVFKPNQASPVITAPFETVYKQTAALWKQEFDTPKPKPVHKRSRITRQQEQIAAALKAQRQRAGLNEVQKQQMRQMFDEALQKRLEPVEQRQQKVEQRQQQVENDHSELAANIKQQTNAFQQLVPMLQQMTASWAYQQQIAYPGPTYPAASMAHAAAQPHNKDVTSTQPGQSNAAHSTPSAQ